MMPHLHVSLWGSVMKPHLPQIQQLPASGGPKHLVSHKPLAAAASGSLSSTAVPSSVVPLFTASPSAVDLSELLPHSVRSLGCPTDLFLCSGLQAVRPNSCLPV